MKVVSFKVCPFVQRVTALLELKNADYDIDYIDLSEKPQWFLDVSPHGQVPILILDDGRVLFESEAIVEYIDEAIGAPVSSADLVQKAQDRAWSYLASKNYLVQCGAQRSPDKNTLNERCAVLSKAFEKIEKRLGDGPFFTSDSVGMVDIAWITILHRASIIERYSGFDFIDGFPKIKRWQKALLATGLAENSVAADFEERFTAFYLSEASYLGQQTKERCGSACFGSAECCLEDMACCA